MKNKTIKQLTLCAMFIALGLVLPFFTGQIPAVGKMLLPMHLPIFLCGLICGWQYGLAAGLITPLLRSLLFSMPVLFPTAVGMAVELCVYGFVSGFLYKHLKTKCIISLYISLITAMLTGRAMWGLAQFILLGISGKAFTAQMFLAGAFSTAIPGIILQLILIPAIMLSLDKTGLVRYDRHGRASA